MKNNNTQQCSCEAVDFFAYLPPEMRPRPKKHSSLRKVTCPICGLVYQTNRDTDICMDCQKKGASSRQMKTTSSSER